MSYAAITLPFGGAIVCAVAKLHFCRLGAVWWAGVAISALGFLALVAVGLLSLA